MGFIEALTLLFVALKLTHVIDWSWWWVLSPTIIDAALILTFIVSIIGVAIKKAR